MATPWGTDLNPIKKFRIVGGRQVEVTSAKAVNRYSLTKAEASTQYRGSPLPPIPPPQARNPTPDKRRVRTRNLQHPRDSSELSTKVNTKLSDLEASFVFQAQESGLDACTTVARNILRLPRDHHDCVEHDDILALFRRSRVVLDAPDFVRLLQRLDVHGNSTAPFDAIPRLLNMAVSVPTDQIHAKREQRRGDQREHQNEPTSITHTTNVDAEGFQQNRSAQRDTELPTIPDTSSLRMPDVSYHTNAQPMQHLPSPNINSNSKALLARIAKLKANRTEFERDFRSRLMQPHARKRQGQLDVDRRTETQQARVPSLPTVLPRIQANRHY
eukprot:m.1339472 g.1339472  ORF g.1339472 m.1339472 type:complete len:329 (+) comp24886_c1_seq1:263-1249(+)